MDVDKLCQLTVFSGMDRKDVETILTYTQTVEYSKGDPIFEKDDPGGTMHIVVSGEVQISAVISHDLRKSLAHVPPGGVFGELSLFTHDLRSAAATATEDSILLTIDTAAFEQMLYDNPSPGSKLLIFLTNIISDRLRNTTDMYRHSLEWSLSVSGAIDLHMDQLITSNVNLTVKLVTGDLLKGQLLKVDQHLAGYVLVIQSDDGTLEIVPYQSVVAMSFDKNALDLKPHADLL